MLIEQIGEFQLIDLLKKNTINSPQTVIAGIGDDAAVLLPTPQQLQLLCTDMLVEKVHFDLKTTTPWQLGYKAMAVNLSDIAAMGGNPRHAVIAVALPRGTDVDFINNLYNGMKEICKEFGVNIVGGDTVSSPQGIVINVTLLGEVEPALLQRRSGAQKDDIVVVTNTLGNSAAGFDLLQKTNWEDHDFAWPLVKAHLTPCPQVAVGRIIAQAGSTAMNDISDGLSSEINEIAQASEVGIKVYADKIPLSPDLQQAADFMEKDSLHYALYGGEDFQLVFTISRGKYEDLVKAHAELLLTPIGEVMDKEYGVRLIANNQEILLEAKGYNHFR